MAPGVVPAAALHLRGAPVSATPTPEQADRIVAVLNACGYLPQAAASAGVSEYQLTVWLGAGALAPESPEGQLHMRVNRALADAETRLVALIATAAGDDVGAAEWLLERRFPERWARLSQRGDASPPQHQPVPPPAADPFTEVDTLAVVEQHPSAAS